MCPDEERLVARARDFRRAEQLAERVADTMYALSTPSRLLILGCLLERPHTVSELTAALRMEQSAVSHQLRILRDYDLVHRERVGRLSVYSLYDEHIAALLDEARRHAEHQMQGGRRRRYAQRGAG